MGFQGYGLELVNNSMPAGVSAGPLGGPWGAIGGTRLPKFHWRIWDGSIISIQFAFPLPPRSSQCMSFIFFPLKMLMFNMDFMVLGFAVLNLRFGVYLVHVFSLEHVGFQYGFYGFGACCVEFTL